MAFAVAIFFEVGLVMFLVVRDQVAQREAIVGSHKVDACARLPPRALEHIRTAGETRGKFPEGLIGAAPVVAHAIAKPAVPFRPSRQKGAELVAAIADVPRFGDQFGLAKSRILIYEAQEIA